MNLQRTRSSLRWLRLLPLCACACLLLAMPSAGHAANGPDLSVTKTCARDSPGSILCTVTVTNIGNTVAAGPLRIEDIPNATSASTFTGGGGSLPIGCSPGAGPVLPISCTAAIAMQPGQTGFALFSFNVPPGDPFANCVSVYHGAQANTLPDANPANNIDICTEMGGSGSGNSDPDPGRLGSATFMKKLRNDNPGVQAPTSYQISLTCNGTTSTGTLAAPGYTQTLSMPAGATCQWQEIAPAAPKGCRWITAYPNGQAVHDGDTLRVENTLQCEPAEPDGKITFVKRVINDTPNKVAGPFDVQVKCSPSITQDVVHLTAPGFQQSIAVSPRAQCKFEETMPEAPKGCKWSVSYPEGQTAKAGDTVVIVNKLECGGGGGNGGGDGPSTCGVRGESLVKFPGTDKVYCCTGKPGSDKFCCTEAKPAKPQPVPMPMRKR